MATPDLISITKEDVEKPFETNHCAHCGDKIGMIRKPSAQYLNGVWAHINTRFIECIHYDGKSSRATPRDLSG